MTEDDAAPGRPSPARMYDYLLGGTTNTKADRQAVDGLLQTLPEIADGAEANRGFLRRSVRYMAELGIDQFIDLGSGLPTQNNTDEVAQRFKPKSRVVLADTDPLVLQHVSRLKQDTVRAVRADVRRPQDVLGDQAVEIIDFQRPVGLLIVAVMHFVTADYRPLEIVRGYLDAVPSGSHLALSHLNGDGQPPNRSGGSKRHGRVPRRGSTSGHGSRSQNTSPALRSFPPTTGQRPTWCTWGNGAPKTPTKPAPTDPGGHTAVGRKP